MKRCYRSLLFSFAASVVLLSSSQVFAKWDSLYTINSGGPRRPANCGFFFNEFVGFVATTGDVGILKTTDGGKSWAAMNIPPGYLNNFTQIIMTDAMNGYAVIEEGKHGNNYLQSILKTTDGGSNWVAIGPAGYLTSIYQTPAAISVTSRSLTGSGYVSADGGATFTPGQLKVTNGIDFVDDLHGVVTGFQSTPWKRTIDGGKTWMNITPVTAPIDTESWGIYGVKGTPIFYAAPETDPRNQVHGDHSNVYRSLDYGATWSLVSPLTFFTTGAIAGFGESVLYVQANNDNSVNPPGVSGFYRSTNQGITWIPVGGPRNTDDTRFVVTGCSGGVVYAFDTNGTIWKTRDGGDGGIIEPPVAPVVQGNPIVFSGPICSTSYAALEMENLYCGNDSILSAQIVDTTSAIISSGALTVSGASAFPILLLPNTKDSLRFTWQPSKIFHSDTTVTIKVKVKYYSNVLGLTFDTIVTVSVHAIGVQPLAGVLPTDLNFQSVSFCAPHDTTITLTNNGCDTLYVLNGNLNAKTHYEILDINANLLNFPLVIPPADSQKVLIRLQLDSAGNYSSDLRLRLFHQGIEKDTTIHIAAIVSAKASFSLPDSVDFGAISTCRELDSILQIKNLGCVPVTITSSVLSNHTVFTLTNPPPSKIQPNSSGSMTIRFKPTLAKQEFDTLTIVFYALGEQQIRKIIIRGSGVLNPAKFDLSLTTDTLFDLHLTRCDSLRTYHVIISNPGCEQITVISADLRGTPTPDITLNPGALAPISDGQSDNVTVTVTPKNLGSYTDSLHIRYQPANSAARDTFLLCSLNVNYGPRILSNDHDTIDLGTMKLCDFRDSAINLKDIGCDTVEIISETIQGNGSFLLTSPPVGFLSANDRTRVPFHFDPIGAGNISAVLTVTTISDSIPIRKIYIIAHVIPTDTTQFDMLPTRSTFYAGDTLTVRLIPQQDIHGRGLRDIAFTINYNGDLLTLLGQPVGVQSTYGTAIAAPAFGTAKHTSNRITLIGNPTLELDKDSPAITFRFYARLTDSITTKFDLTDIQLNGGDVLYAKCDFGILSASLIYQLGYHCGDSTLVKFMLLGDNFKIFTDAVYPNPLTQQNNYQGIIQFHASAAGDFSMSVYDGMGRIVLTARLQTQSPGSYSFLINGRDLASGFYSYLLQNRSSSGTARGRFMIAK